MTDYNFLMESRLSPEQFQVINHLSRLAAGQGLNFYLVGGAVRDLTYGQQVVRDLDFAVEGNPQKIIRALGSDRPPGRGSGSPAAPGIEPVPFRVEHLSWDPALNAAQLTFTNGVRAEIAMTRQESYSKPGRRPDISPGTIFDDLRRRDFSMNAMGVSLHPNSRGLLLDPTNGAADLEKREARALHSRSFLEDPSRLYRLLRLGLRLDFKPEERTQAWFEAAVENRVWQRLNPTQQRRELRAILREHEPGRALRMLTNRGLLVGLDRKLSSAKISYELFAKIRSVAQTVPGADPFLLNFHYLVRKFSSSQRSRLARMILPDKKSVKLALSLEVSARKLARLLASSKAALPSQVFTLLDGQPQPLLLFSLVHFPQGKILNRVKNFIFKYPPVRAKLPRAELQAMGVKPAPQFEKILHCLFLDQLDGRIKTHQQLLEEYRRLAGIAEPPKKPSKPTPPVRRSRAKKN